MNLEVASGDSIRRRRMCTVCSNRFTTYERIERPQLIVVKNNNVRELFKRDKLLSGLYRACEKTPVTSVQIEQLVGEVEEQLYACGETEVPTSKIGEILIGEATRN